MPSTYSALLRTELVATGEQAGTWGGVNNNNIGSFLEAAIAGTVSHNTAGAANTTLTALNGTADEARSHVIKLTGVLTGSHSVICPLVSKTYLVINNTTGAFAITFIGATGTGVVCPQGSYMLLYCDGTNVYNQLTNTTLATPVIGAATGTSLVLSSTASATRYTSTIATGTSPFVVASTTEVANLKAATATLATTATNLSGGTVAATSVTSTGALTSSSPTAGVGYATGAGTTYTQATSITTAVATTTMCGQITTFTGTFFSGSWNFIRVTGPWDETVDVVSYSVRYANGGGQVAGFAGCSGGGVEQGIWLYIVGPNTSSIVFTYAVNKVALA